MGGRGEGLGVDIEGGGQVGFSWFRGIALTRRRFRWAAVPSWVLDFKSRWLIAWWVLMTLYASHKARRRFHRKNKRPKRAFRKKNLDPAKRMS